nr:trypsin-like peptidase domain-containing protein [uncultured Sellimonas sp.]
MGNEYEYYDPNQQNQQFYGNNGDFREPDKHDKKKKNKGTKIAAVVGLAVLFGVVGGVTFQATNLATGKILGTSNGSKNKVETAELTQSSDGTVTDTDITKIVKNSMPFVVSIQNMSVKQVQDFFGGIREQKQESVGTGIIVGQNNNELLVVTNNHVVEGSTVLTVTFNDEKSVEASIKGTDSTKDLAVVAVPLNKISNETKKVIKVATLGDSEKLQVGEEVIAIGNALGYGQSVTNGIVSAKERDLQMEGFDCKLIQTNAAINPGNSGGALLNSKGEVVGINTVKVNDSAVEGMGYAIPISDVADAIKGLMNKETRTQVPEAQRGYIGIKGFDLDEQNAEQFGMPSGVYVSEVLKNGGAEKAGITKGCIITGIEGSGVSNMEGLQNQLSYYRIGEKVKVKVQFPADGGNYKEKEVEVKLTAQLSE